MNTAGAKARSPSFKFNANKKIPAPIIIKTLPTNWTNDCDKN